MREGVDHTVGGDDGDVFEHEGGEVGEDLGGEGVMGGGDEGVPGEVPDVGGGGEEGEGVAQHGDDGPGGGDGGEGVWGVGGGEEVGVVRKRGEGGLVTWASLVLLDISELSICAYRVSLRSLRGWL